ncbi:hypothetical protein M655_024755 [Brevibacillus sp. NSP2.1]|uniref:hypothetical protein n=1 Tax=Brevibacillus sp. NSP2.1 TaxID=3003229 RepID=UPI00042A164D|nr:hypothetical protein [Brevibacillus sp. NSP2.1]QHZ58586.1 hypothetical protein M655_024755 [Brevibacillus sp. NSP2.1]
MSSGQTNTLGLHRWVGTDRVSRAEIVENFDIIDATAEDLYGQIEDLRLLIARLDVGWSIADEINFRYPDNAGIFYDILDGKGGRVTAVLADAATYTTAALSAGATTVPVGDSAAFAVGEEVTIYDDVNAENVRITAITDNTLTVGALVNAYKAKATVARTTAVTDAVNARMVFPSWGTSNIAISEA